MRIVCVSDGHYVPAPTYVIPQGDVLIYAGDFTWIGSKVQVRAFNRWLRDLPHPVKLVTAGNHDRLFSQQPAFARGLISNATYLQDEGVEIDGVKFWLSPWSPTFGDGWSFNAERGEEIRKKWELIPDDTDVLVTHGPPFGYGDMTARGERVGCEELLQQIQNRIKPILAVSGHLHEDHGIRSDGVTTYVNASICTLGYKHGNLPIVVEINNGVVTVCR